MFLFILFNAAPLPAPRGRLAIISAALKRGGNLLLLGLLHFVLSEGRLNILLLG